MHRIISYYPFVLVCLFQLFVIRAYFSLGRMPFPYHPDPKDLEFTFHHNLIWFLYFGYPFAFVLWLLTGRISGFARTSSLVFLGGALLSLLMWVVQNELINWFMD